MIVTYGYNTKLRNSYSVVEGESEEACRKEAMARTEGQFAFMYPMDDDTAAMIHKFQLQEVPLQRPQLIKG